MFFGGVKNFPQENKNTREIIEIISEIIFAAYIPTDFQMLDG